MPGKKHLPTKKAAKKWLVEIGGGVLDKLIGPREGRNIISVLIIVVIVTVLPSTFTMATKGLFELKRESEIHAMQDAIIELESRIPTLRKSVKSGESRYRKIDYVDHITKKKIVTDIWESQQLAYRTFYIVGNMVARDTFSYVNNRIIGKKREYFEGSVLVMTEDFSATGVLLNKKHCIKGDPASCRTYLRDLRSPLPPVNYAFYR